MYGKHFESMYTGSMYGQTPIIFAVWGYVIANENRKTGTVELNPAVLSAVFGGEPLDKIVGAIEFLCAPDPNSRTKSEGGRRLIRGGQFLYKVVNSTKYGLMRNEDNRLTYQRNWDRENRPSGHKREKTALVGQKEPQPDKSDSSPTQSDKSDTVRPTETETETETDKGAGAPRPNDLQFERFWEVWPKHVKKSDAKKVWRKLRPSEELTNIIIAAVVEQKAMPEWTKERGQYIPAAGVWLRGERWEDEITPQAPKKLSIEEKDIEGERLKELNPDKLTQDERDLLYAYNGRQLYYADGGTPDTLRATRNADD